MKKLSASACFAFVGLLSGSIGLSGCEVSVPDTVWSSAEPKIILPSATDLHTDFQTLAVELYPAARHSDEVMVIEPLEDRSEYQFISAGKDGRILLWKTEGNRSFLTAQIADEIDTVAVDPNKGIVAWTNDLTAHVASLDLKKQLTYHIPSRAKSICFTADGHTLVIGALDAKVYRWRFDIQSKVVKKNDKERVLERYVGATEVISAVQPHPDNNIFFSADYGGAIQAWQAYTADRLKGEDIVNLISPMYVSASAVRNKASREIKTERIERMKVSVSGAELFVATNLGSIEIWKVRGLQKVGVMQAHTSDIYALAVSPSGGHIASAGRDGDVNVFSIRLFTPEELKLQTDRTIEYEILLEKTYPIGEVRALNFLQETRLAAGKKDGSVLAIDTTK